MTDIQKTSLTVYAMTLVGSLLMMVPTGIIPFAGMACLVVGLGSAYIYRWRSNDPVMTQNMTYMIRTVWWATLILFIGITFFCSIIVTNGDLSMIHALTEQAERGLVPTDSDIRIMQHHFLNTNKKIIQISALISLLPYPLYLIVRTVKGARAITKKN